MSEENDDSQKTEDPTSKRLDEARNEGRVAKSQEFNHLLMILALTLAVFLFGRYAAEQISQMSRPFLESPDPIPTDLGHLLGIAWRSLGLLLFAGIAPIVLALLAAFGASYLQFGLLWSAENMMPRLDKISSLAGFKRIFSPRSVTELLKGVLKEKGVRQLLNEGAIAGFPIQDLRVIVYDGKHHPVDSKEVALAAAGRPAFQNAFREAGTIVLEPIVRIEVTSPSSVTGDITGDLATRRGRVSGSHSLAGQRTRIAPLVPLAELNDYQSRVKSLTGGEGSYTMELSHYDPVPPRKQQELMKAFKTAEED